MNFFCIPKVSVNMFTNKSLVDLLFEIARFVATNLVKF